MQIRWSNLIAFIVLLVVCTIAIKNAEEIAAFFSTMKNIDGRHSTEDQIKGLLAYGIVIVSILAVLKILLNSQDKDQ